MHIEKLIEKVVLLKIVPYNKWKIWNPYDF